MNIERIRQLQEIINDPRVMHRHDTPYIVLRDLLQALLDDPPQVQKAGGVTPEGKEEQKD